MLPPAPVPVPLEPAIVKFAPAVLLVPATTDWTVRVCATGAAASVLPSRSVAAACRPNVTSAVVPSPAEVQLIPAVDMRLRTCIGPQQIVAASSTSLLTLK